MSARGGPATVSGTCDVCGKHTMFGHNVSFSKRRTNRRFKANVQRRTVVVNGVSRRVDMCVRCMRTAVKSA
ncbi:MAG: 50S ribosomal protein L28 [Chloroflexota bacterium]|nr:50S ribosomal protein L28 [Chloroflexota bacterium]